MTSATIATALWWMPEPELELDEESAGAVFAGCGWMVCVCGWKEKPMVCVVMAVLVREWLMTPLGGWAPPTAVEMI